MTNGIYWGIPYHSWPCPAHHFTDGLAFFRSIAMSRTILASCLLFAIREIIRTTTSELCQMQVFIRHCVLMKMMATIQLNHLTDCSLLSLNSAQLSMLLLVWVVSFYCIALEAYLSLRCWKRAETCCSIGDVEHGHVFIISLIHWLQALVAVQEFLLDGQCLVVDQGSA